MYINPDTDSYIFSGIFSVDPNTNIITSFYERVDDYDNNSSLNTQNILDPVNTNSSSYLYNPTLGCFDEYGLNITFIRQLGGQGKYKLFGPIQITTILSSTYCTIMQYGTANGDITYTVKYNVNETSAPVGISDPGIVLPQNMRPYQIISMLPSGFVNMPDNILNQFTTNNFSYLNMTQINAILPTRANILSYQQIASLQRPSTYVIWYNIIIYNDIKSPIFNGYLSINSDTNIILNMFSSTNINMNLIAYESYSDYKFIWYDSSKARNFSTLGTAFVSSTLNNSLQPNANKWKLIGNSNKVVLYYSMIVETNPGEYAEQWTQYSSYSIIANVVPYSPLNPPCFGQDTKILGKIGDDEQYIPITDLRKGSLVKTLKHGFVPIDMIGKSTIDNLGTDERIKSRLYKLSLEKYPELSEDLVLTGCHSLLVDRLTDEQQVKTIELMEHVYVTDGKYRLLTCLDDRADPLMDEDEFPIYHIALENEDYYANYGIWANGLLVETCSKRYMKEFSKMTLL